MEKVFLKTTFSPFIHAYKRLSFTSFKITDFLLYCNAFLYPIRIHSLLEDSDNLFINHARPMKLIIA